MTVPPTAGDRVDVVGETRRAQVLLHPTRLAILEALEVPGSASKLATRLEASRQRLNYHLRELEAAGLVQLTEERRRGSVCERIYRRVGDTYAISAAALGNLGTCPERVADHRSSAYQIAVASQAIADIATLLEGAEAAGKRLPTLTLDGEIAFESPDSRRRFAEELTEAVAALVQKYHTAGADGRVYKLYVGAYPKPKPKPKRASADDNVDTSGIAPNNKGITLG